MHIVGDSSSNVVRGQLLQTIADQKVQIVQVKFQP